MKKCIRAIIFTAGLLALLAGVSYVVTPKDSAQKLNSFFREENDFDVLFLGISHMQVAVHPYEMWNDYGFTSFDFGESGNTIDSSYWVLRNALDYTKPKLVVIDIRHMDAEEDKTFANYFRYNYDRFPLTKTKIEAALDLMPTKEKALELLVPILQFHNRWNSLKGEDLTTTITERVDHGSYRYGTKKLAVATPELHSGRHTTASLEGTAYATGYLRRIIELCQAQGIEVLLTEFPYPATKEARMLANGVQAIADEYGVSYLNFLEEDKIDVINLYTDMNDSYSHVNDSGARKVSDYLGAYITTHYDIPDHRTDASYASWDEGYKEYTLYKENRILGQKALDKSLMLLSDKNISSCVYIRAGSPVLSDERLAGLVANLTERSRSALPEHAENAALSLPVTVIPETEELSSAIRAALQAASEENKDFFAVIDNASGAVNTYVGESDIRESLAGLDISYRSDGETNMVLSTPAYTVDMTAYEDADVCIIAADANGEFESPLLFKSSVPSSDVKGVRTALDS